MYFCMRLPPARLNSVTIQKTTIDIFTAVRPQISDFPNFFLSGIMIRI
jgi:hypothetical protein